MGISGGREGPDWAGGARRLLRLVSVGLGRAIQGFDAALGWLDDTAALVRDAVLRALRLNEADVTVRKALEDAPPWLTRGVAAFGSFLGSLGAFASRLFSYLPGDREWKRAASGMALLLAVVTVSNLTAPVPEAKPLLPGAWSPIVVGYFENGWSAMYPDSYPTLQRYAERIDIVMPFWYSLYPDGSIEDRGYRKEVVDFAHSSGIPVVPLVNNAKTGASAGFLTDPAARQEAAASLANLVAENGFDGIHLDFELLPAWWGSQLTSFIAEVRAALGPSKHLSMAVFPKVGVSTDVSGIYDYAALSGFCDFLVIMCYDEHYAGGPAGPVSPYDWTEANISYAVKDVGVPANKVVVAVGGYGYDWPLGGMATDVPSQFIPDLARRTGATTRWDETSRNPYFTYYSGRTRHDVWYQDERVMADRISLARKYNLRGLAIWRLGYETQATWSVLMSEIGSRRASLRVPGR